MAPMSARTRPLIDVRAATVCHGTAVVLDRVDLTIGRGEIVTLIGPNGSGKSTLVRAALGLVPLAAGAVDTASSIRIGYVPQHFSVDSTLPITVGRFLQLGVSATDADCLQALTTVRAARIQDAPLHRISGGEIKRALLARALLRKPDLLVLDEPSAGVDVTGQAELYDLIVKIRDQQNCGVLLVSHDLHLVMAATDRVVCLNHHVCCAGRPDAVAQHPEYLNLFGAQLARRIAVYTHHHDHQHDLAGKIDSGNAPPPTADG
ncbi:MAG: zinc ABC transporter ATP-binding protein ZnuC [Gammaproteobacteria bacterium]|nr:zinc ABC transporter ATP-binding protein ZnuC [Gammaproteobacteria bacterium]